MLRKYHLILHVLTFPKLLDFILGEFFNPTFSSNEVWPEILLSNLELLGYIYINRFYYRTYVRNNVVCELKKSTKEVGRHFIDFLAGLDVA